VKTHEYPKTQILKH